MGGPAAVTAIVGTGAHCCELALLEQVGRARERGDAVAVLRGRRVDADATPRPVPTVDVLAVVDAQWLPDTVLGEVVDRIDAGTRVLVSHRPRPDRPALAEIDARAAAVGGLVHPAPLDRDGTAARLAARRGRAVDVGRAARIHAAAAGLPLWIDALAGPDDDPDGADRLVGTLLGILDDDARAVWCGLCAGVAPTEDVLSALVDGDDRRLARALWLLRDEGCLDPRTDLPPPVAAEAVLRCLPPGEQAVLVRRLTDVVADAWPPLEAARLLLGRTRGPRAAAVFRGAGDATLCTDPGAALEWYRAATAAGAAPGSVAGREAAAAVLCGRIGEARLAVDAASRVPDPGERRWAAAARAAVAVVHGRWDRAAAAYRAVGEDPVARNLAAVCAVAVGDLDAAADDLEVGADGTDGSLAAEVSHLMARGAWASVTEPAREAVALLVEAAEAAEHRPAAPAGLPLPVTPHALAAMVASAAGDPDTAARLLDRAVRLGVGGPGEVAHHELTAGWVAVIAGAWSVAQRSLGAIPYGELTPRDRHLADIVDAALARRSDDLPRMQAALRRARDVLVGLPPHLWITEPVAELGVVASRVGEAALLRRHIAVLGAIVAAVGSPPLWALPLRWSALQAAVHLDDAGRVRHRADALAEVATGPEVGLAEAAGVWADVVAGDVDPARVRTAVDRLRSRGRFWEASRLAGAAAIRAADGSVTRALLELARDMRALLPDATAEEVPAAGALSERELEVARAVADGHTYKEIAASLYISPKTVEHHVAKIRQKLGASTRAEMLSALREILPDR